MNALIWENMVILLDRLWLYFVKLKLGAFRYKINKKIFYSLKARKRRNESELII